MCAVAQSFGFISISILKLTKMVLILRYHLINVSLGNHNRLSCASSSDNFQDIEHQEDLSSKHHDQTLYPTS